MSEEPVGQIPSIDPVTHQRVGTIQVATNGGGNVVLRARRVEAEATLRFRPAMALRVAELLSRAAFMADSSGDMTHEQTKQVQRRMRARQLLVARQIVQLGSRDGVGQREVVEAIASALANELRSGIAMAHANEAASIVAGEKGAEHDKLVA